MNVRMLRALVFAASLLVQLIHVPAHAGEASPDREALRAFRDEALAYSVGLQAYIYGFPAVDFERVMREQTTRGLDPHGVYAPVNHIYFQTRLAEPGGLYAGRAPNNDTVYFTAWLDLRNGPVTIDAPDTHDRYYALTYADLYSEVQHTGRRTTGTHAQRVMVVGPDWAGEAPAGVTLIRLKTKLGYLLGRTLVDGPKNLDTVNALDRGFRITAPDGNAQPLELPSKDQLTSIEFFSAFNRFLRDNPRLPGEEALMTQFDIVGIGPTVKFDPALISSGTRKGFERAIADGHRILAESPFTSPPSKGWGPIRQLMGVYGANYLARAETEYNGFLGNLPEESVYPSALSDQDGNPLDGAKRYRLIFAPNATPPVDAFWSLSAYSARTLDLMPNPLRRYTLGDRTPDLKKRADGAIEIRIQNDRPAEPDVNWLPVADGPFFLTLRMYQPSPKALGGAYKLPPVELVQ